MMKNAVSRIPRCFSRRTALYGRFIPPSWTVCPARIICSSRLSSAGRKVRTAAVPWGEPDVLFAREGSFCRQPIQVLASGRWIFANWLCSDSASRSGRRPDGVSDLRRSGLYLAHCRDAGQQRPCTCQCGGACAGTSRGVHAGAVRQISFIAVNRWTTGNTWSEPVPTVLPNNKLQHQRRQAAKWTHCRCL